MGVPQLIPHPDRPRIFLLFYPDNNRYIPYRLGMSTPPLEKHDTFGEIIDYFINSRF